MSSRSNGVMKEVLSFFEIECVSSSHWCSMALMLSRWVWNSVALPASISASLVAAS
jgi:hypothetical protein